MEQKKITERAADVTRRFYLLNEKARKKDLTALKDDIDTSRKNYRDIFDYGLLLCVNGIENARLDEILSNLIKHEKNEQEIRFKSIQKEAVTHIQKGSHSRLFSCSLFTYLDIEEIKEMRSYLTDTVIYEDINLLINNQSCKDKITGKENDNSSAAKVTPFNFIKDADNNILIEQLKQEQPSVIAYILAMLDSKKSSFILSNLSSELQSDIAYRIAVMDNPKIDLLFDILRFEKKLLSISGMKYANMNNDEFEKLLTDYLLRENAVKEALDLYKKASNATVGSEEAVALTNRLIHVMRGKPLDFLEKNPVSFFGMLVEEHPKTIAYILSIIEPTKAALMLRFLPDYLQCDAARRIALMEKGEIISQELRETVSEIPPAEIRAMEKKISAMFNKDCVFEGGIKKLVALLFLVDNQTFTTIIEFIEKHFPEIFAMVSNNLFVFEDIVMLDDRATQKVMRNIDAECLAAALKYASDEIKEKIFRNMTKRAAVMLKEEIEYKASLSAAECAAAQKKIVLVIRRLEEVGEIILAISNEEYV